MGRAGTASKWNPAPDGSKSEKGDLMLSLYPEDEEKDQGVVTYQHNEYSPIETWFEGSYEDARAYFDNYIEERG